MAGGGAMLVNLEKTSSRAEIRETDLFLLREAVKNKSALEFKKFLKSRWCFTYSWSDYEMALQLAAELGKLDVVKVLVNEKTNIHAKDEYALRWAAENGHDDVVHFLLKKGANINALYPSVREKYLPKKVQNKN